jgi:arginyl-tRNA synthetase
MAQDVKIQLTALLQQALASVAPTATETPIHLERPRDPTHGDFATNLAMQLAKALKKNPREIANQLLAELPPSKLVTKAEVAGAGFINFTLDAGTKTDVVKAVLAEGADFGRSRFGGAQKVQVEFVSANPTGPLHVGHGRGAAYGASLSSLLAFAGWDVTREYYVNDAGRQMDILGLSTWLRYLDQHGVSVPFPPNGYQGAYVRDMAEQLKHAHGDKYVRTAEAVLAGTPGLPDAGRADDEAKQQRELHLDALIANAKSSLGPDWDYVHQHALERAVGRLPRRPGGIRRPFRRLVLREGALRHRAGRPLRRPARRKGPYLSAERRQVVQIHRLRRREGPCRPARERLVYLFRLRHRLSPEQVRAWLRQGHQHLGRRPPRLHPARHRRDQGAGARCRQAAGGLVQFAVLYRNGQKASMSTRSGEFVTLRELRGEVGNDACRFFYALRKSDQHLDFDLDLAKSQTNENPVYYIQYAHARVCSVINQWDGDLAVLAEADLSLLSNPRELAIANQLAHFREVIENAARDLAPHLIAFYLKDLAGEFHGWYNAERMLVDDAALRDARVALAAAVRQTIRNGMAILGVSCPESM